MTKEEYAEKSVALNKEYDKKRKELALQYAEENNKVKVGDYITDHRFTIRVTGYRVYCEYTTKLPSLIYTGIKCKKNGEPMKNPSEEDVYQINLKYINGVLA